MEKQQQQKTYHEKTANNIKIKTKQKHKISKEKEKKYMNPPSH